ncbi:MAG: hypothetical protein GTO08_01940, partial [Deltaproteobacteria bacterium]|nr:hypothetical protein [Deltaproteobacteria bacterium]
MEERAFTVHRGEVLSSLFGTVELTGSIHNLPSSDPDLNISIAAREIPLSILRIIASGLPPAAHDADDEQGSGRADIRVTGTYRSPRASGILSATLKKMNTGDVILTSALVKVPFEYASETFMVRQASLEASEVIVPRGGHDRDPRLRAENCALHMPAFDMREGFIGSGEFVLRADSVVMFQEDKEFFRDAGIILEGELEGERKQQNLLVRKIFSASGVLNGLTGSIHVIFGSPVRIKTFFTGNGIDLHTVAGKFPLHEKVRKVSVRGETSLRFHSEISVPHDQAPRVAGTFEVTVRKGGFSS